ncbi:MAG TPA: YafY family protein [Streptosporangiaceae bacterium]|jgi:predicted DNA-binding transcriptional regulator YafY
MRASRLVSLLLLLQARGRLTARQLASELEVSVRTVYRDVESLHAAGVPLYGEAGPDGGYQLLDGYRTRLTGLTAPEAESLFLAGLPGPAAELGLGTVVATAQLKMMAALPAELRDRAGRISARFHLDAPGWYTGSDPAPYLAAAAAAVWDEQVIEVRYRRWKAPDEVTRTLQPYGLVLKAGRWYLAAAGGSEPGRVATYRVSQILDLRPVSERFERPADFDLAGYWQAYLADFESRRHRGTAVIRLSPAGRDRARHLLEPAVSRAIGQTAGPPDESGWVRAVIPVESPAHAASDLLRLGADAEALEPAELRALMISTIEQLARAYAPPADADIPL